MRACGGSTGTTQGVAGAGGGAAGAGGSAGAAGSGGAPVTSCPTERPTTGTACAGSFTCNYTDAIRCNVSCYSSYMCSNGRLMFLGNNDGCFQVTCSSDAGTDADPTTTVCTFGMDQTCNDNPFWSSIQGRCTDAGVCVCGDGGANPTTGRCLMPGP